MNTSHICLVDDNDDFLAALAEMLELAGHSVTATSNARSALQQIDEHFSGIVISDIRMPDIDGMELLQKCVAIDPDLPVILVTGHGDVQLAVQAIRQGAYDFIEKPFRRETLLDIVTRAIEKRRLVLENRALRKQISQDSNTSIIGRSPSIMALKEQVAQIGKVDVTTLIHGETGTGKELVALSLHSHSHRCNGPFVAVNCGSIPETMIESELFGHVAGAFTDAKKARIGKIEHAQGGTLFLDEIESIPLTLAVKILRVLQERKLEPLGSNKSVDLDIRVVAATKTDLKALSATGEFREDLYYRLNVVELMLPPLRERGQDIELLFRHFLMVAAERFNTSVPPVSAAERESLYQHTWPGNVRELINAAQRFTLTGILFPDADSQSDGDLDDDAGLRVMVAAYEQRLIEQTLLAEGGSIKRTCEKLQLPRKTLYDKLTKYEIDRTMFKAS